MVTLKISATLTSPPNCCRVAESTPPSPRAARQPCPPPRALAPRPGARSCTRAPPRLAPPRLAHRVDKRCLRAAQLAERFGDRPRPDPVAGLLVERRAARAGTVPLRSALAPGGARDERGADDLERRVADIVNRRLSRPHDPTQRLVELHQDRGHGVAARVHLLGVDRRDRELGEHVDHVQVLHVGAGVPLLLDRAARRRLYGERRGPAHWCVGHRAVVDEESRPAASASASGFDSGFDSDGDGSDPRLHPNRSHPRGHPLLHILRGAARGAHALGRRDDCAPVRAPRPRASRASHRARRARRARRTPSRRRAALQVRRAAHRGTCRRPPRCRPAARRPRTTDSAARGSCSCYC